MRTIALDFETFYSKKAGYGVKLQGTWNYVHDSRFAPYLVSVSDGATSWAGPLKDFNWQALAGARVLSHNRYFDSLVYRRACELGLSETVNPAEWHCTANLTSYLCNRRALADAIDWLYKRELDKSARGDMDGKHWSDLSPAERTRMLHYAVGDAAECHRIWTDFSPRWNDFERRLSNLTIDQGYRGVAVNVELLDKYLVVVHDMLENTYALLPWLERGNKPTSSKGVAEECRRAGIPCPPVKSHDPEEFVEWEKMYAPRHPWIKALGACRSLKSLFSRLQTIKERVRPDGTMPFALKYFGAHTGRWSGDEGINLQNERKDAVLRNEHGLMENDADRLKAAYLQHDEAGSWPEWVTAVIDTRALFIARPGKKLIICDLSQIEPRVLNWLAGNHALLGKLAGGMSIYEAHAVETMGFKGSNMKHTDKQGYKLAKARVLGLGYQCGWEKFISVAWAMARLDVTENDPEWIDVTDPTTGVVETVPGYGKFAKECVESFRASNPLIVELWRRLDDGFKSSVGGDFTVTLPSGRKMTYPRIRREVRVKADEDGKPKKTWLYTADVGFRREGFYGGKITENIVQAASRDVFGESMLHVIDAGAGECLFHVHDEGVFECEPDVSPRDVEQLMSRTPAWLAGCPIGAEAVESQHYLK